MTLWSTGRRKAPCSFDEANIPRHTLWCDETWRKIFIELLLWFSMIFPLNCTNCISPRSVMVLLKHHWIYAVLLPRNREVTPKLNSSYQDIISPWRLFFIMGWGDRKIDSGPKNLGAQSSGGATGPWIWDPKVSPPLRWRKHCRVAQLGYTVCWESHWISGTPPFLHIHIAVGLANWTCSPEGWVWSSQRVC